MTQALLNKLNNTCTDYIKSGVQCDKEEPPIKFSEIYKQKTADKNQTASTQDTNIGKNDTAKNIKNNKEKTSTKRTSTINETDVQETDDETKAQDEYTDATEEGTVINEDTTITDEDPTMYKEQITLENPGFVLMTQAQIITKQQNVQEEENVNVGNSIMFKNTGTDFLVNEQAKSALAQSSVKYTEIPVKDSSASKADIAKQVKNIIDEEKIRDLNIEIIESDSTDGDSASGDLMQNQTPQEQAAKVMIRGDVRFDSIKTLQQADSLKYSAKPAEVTPNRIVEQITKQLEGMYSNSKVNIVLNPESLGKVALNIMNTKDGLFAQFTVTTQEARDLLTRGLSGLKEGLLAQGVSVDNVTVKLNETGDGEHQSDLTEQDGSKGGYKGQGFRRQKDNQKGFEQMMIEINENGNV